MSLINDALKKAQNLQTRGPALTPAFPRANTPATSASGLAPANTGTAATPVANTAPLVDLNVSPTPATPLRRGKTNHSGLVLGIVLSVLLAGMGALGYVVYAVFFSPTPADQIAQAAATPAVADPAPAAPAPVPPAKDVGGSDTPAPAPVSAAKIVAPAPAPATAPKPAAPTAGPAESKAAAATAASPVPAPQLATAPAPVAEPEPVEEHVNNPSPIIQAWVDKITVTGVREGDRPKALMNDRVYLIGDVVSPEHGLKLAKIGARELVFEDAEGNTYSYRY